MVWNPGTLSVLASVALTRDPFSGKHWQMEQFLPPQGPPYFLPLWKGKPFGQYFSPRGSAQVIEYTTEQAQRVQIPRDAFHLYIQEKQILMYLFWDRLLLCNQVAPLKLLILLPQFLKNTHVPGCNEWYWHIKRKNTCTMVQAMGRTLLPWRHWRKRKFIQKPPDPESYRGFFPMKTSVQSYEQSRAVNTQLVSCVQTQESKFQW